MRKVSKGGELAPFTSCTVQLPAAQDWRWCGTCAILAPASYGQEVKARATSASHQRAWLCARIMRVSHRESLKNRFEKDHKVLSMDTLFSTQLHGVIFMIYTLTFLAVKLDDYQTFDTGHICCKIYKCRTLCLKTVRKQYLPACETQTFSVWGQHALQCV